MLKIKKLALTKLDTISTGKAYPLLSLHFMHADTDRSHQWLKPCCVKD